MQADVLQKWGNVLRIPRETYLRHATNLIFKLANIWKLKTQNLLLLHFFWTFRFKLGKLCSLYFDLRCPEEVKEEKVLRFQFPD